MKSLGEIASPCGINRSSLVSRTILALNYLWSCPVWNSFNSLMSLIVLTLSAMMKSTPVLLVPLRALKSIFRLWFHIVLFLILLFCFFNSSSFWMDLIVCASFVNIDI